MPKITLNELASLTNETTALSELNQNFETIQDAIDNLLSRDGTSPNSMDANLDMNSFRIQNLPEAVANTEPVRLGDIAELVAPFVNTTQWYYGSGTPNASLHEINDWYLDTTSFNIFKKTAATTWVLVANIKGATGSQGPAGPGSGDMLKSTYDTNNNGIVDSAAAVPWSGVTSKPTTAVGYGITDVPWSVVTGRPTTRAGYGISDAQPLDATLTALAGLSTAADRLPYTTGVDTFALTNFTAFGRSLVDDPDDATARTTLGLGTMATRTAISTGDLVNAAVTLAKFDTTGTDGQVLTAKGPGVTPAWQTPTGTPSPAYTLIGTYTPVAASATLTVSGLNLSQYVGLFIEFSDIRFSASASFRVNSLAISGLSVSSTGLVYGYLECFLQNGFAMGLSAVGTSTTVTQTNIRPNIVKATTSITFSPSTGTFTSGTVRIYGVK